VEFKLRGKEEEKVLEKIFRSQAWGKFWTCFDGEGEFSEKIKTGHLFSAACKFFLNFKSNNFTPLSKRWKVKVRVNMVCLIEEKASDWKKDNFPMYV